MARHCLDGERSARQLCGAELPARQQEEYEFPIWLVAGV
jgi:hypothetical protein